MDVLVNQLGYAPGTQVGAIVRCSPGAEPDTARLEVASTGAVVASAEPERAGHVEDWRNWIFWTVELPPPTDSGEYVVAVERSAANGEPAAGATNRDATGDESQHPSGERSEQTPGVVRSRRFSVEPDLLRSGAVPDVLSYFRVERCTGVYDRVDREAPFVGEREDTVDVRGGWYDASGDVSKYLSHLSYGNYTNPQQIPLVAWSLLDAGERFDRDDGLGRALARDALEEACYGADYLVRVQDDAGYFYVTVFDGWSADPARREICAFERFEGEKTADYEAGFRQGGGVAIAALARASRLGDAGDLPADGGEFGRDRYREAAVEGFEHLQDDNERYLDDGTENLLDDYCALLAATELAGALRDDGDPERGSATDVGQFRSAADERVRALLDHQTDAGWFYADDGQRPFFHATDEGLPIVALCRYLDVVGDGHALADDVRDAIRDYWTFELALTDGVVNPFGYARQYAKGVDDDEPRGRFFMPHENETGYWWGGENARLGSLATAALATAEVLDVPDLAPELRSFASDQIDWILGLNPFDTCMLEGVGHNPEPFVATAPQTPGGIANGVTAGVGDPAEIAFVPEAHADDSGTSWRWTEQWLTHGAWFLAATTRLSRNRV